MTVQALVGADILLPDGIVADSALLVDGARIVKVARRDRLPAGCTQFALEGGWLLPGFIDTQVNGGGDVLFNDQPDAQGIRTIAQAHRRFGTTGLLPVPSIGPVEAAPASLSSANTPTVIPSSPVLIVLTMSSSLS